jgi:hypothetical protein
MATLNLPDTPRTLVWRAIVERLQADPDLDSAIATWIVWDGGTRDNADLSRVKAPALRLYPISGPMTWYDAQSQQGALAVALEAWLPGLDVEDLLNLQGALEAALSPDDGHAFRRSLVAAGAVTGLIEFVAPLAQPHAAAGEQGGFHPLGQFKIDVLRSLIP